MRRPSSSISSSNPKRTARSFNLIVVGALGVFILSTWVGFLLFQTKPSLFYFRAYEFCNEYGCEEPWRGPEKGDLSRDFAFLFQDSWPTIVTYDQDGNRIVPTCGNLPQILFWGDSYVRGAALSDDETLPWQVGGKTGVPVHNGSGKWLGDILSDPRLADVKIILEVGTERGIGAKMYGIPLSLHASSPSGKQAESGNTETFSDNATRDADPNRWHPLFKAWRFLKRMWGDATYLVENRNNPRRYLYDHWSTSQEEIDRTIEGVRQHADFLESRGYKYVFIPVPSKQTIYGLGDGLSPHPLTLRANNILISALEGSGVRTVNLMPIFESNKTSHQLFFRTDSHWRPFGVNLSAEAIVNYLRSQGLLNDLAPCN